MLGLLWVMFRLGPSMSAVDLVQWALLIALLTVVGSISQFGIKPGYMQEVTDRGAEHRHAALRISLLAVGTSGLLAGALVAAILYFLWMLGEWHNLAVLSWLPLYGLLGNVGMMFQTDLRILGGARLLAALAIITFPLSVLLLEIALRAGFDPLAAFFCGAVRRRPAHQPVVHAPREYSAARRSRPGLSSPRTAHGAAGDGGLLSRYVADLSVSATFRWGADDAAAGAFGLAVRVTEPLMALYIGSFQMAWARISTGWIREAPDGALARRHSARSWWLAMLGLPLGIAIAALVFALVQQEAVQRLDWLFAAMMISRVLAFGMASRRWATARPCNATTPRECAMRCQETPPTATLLPALAFASGAIAAVTVCGDHPLASPCCGCGQARRGVETGSQSALRWHARPAANPPLNVDRQQPRHPSCLRRLLIGVGDLDQRRFAECAPPEGNAQRQGSEKSAGHGDVPDSRRSPPARTWRYRSCGTRHRRRRDPDGPGRAVRRPDDGIESSFSSIRPSIASCDSVFACSRASWYSRLVSGARFCAAMKISCSK
jgi:hypothetical protein